MKTPNRILLILAMSLALGCSKSEDADVNNPDGKDPEPDPVELVTYNLTAVNNSGTTGTAKLIRNQDGTSTIFIELISAPEGLHPAAVHFNSLEEGGSAVATGDDSPDAARVRRNLSEDGHEYPDG